MSDTHDLSCLIPVLEAGAEIPDFERLDRDGRWYWHPRHAEYHVAVDDKCSHASAYFAAIGWLATRAWDDGYMTGRDDSPGLSVGWHANGQSNSDPCDLQALCAAWLREHA